MNREQVFAFAKKTYGTTPEYLWRKSPDSAVLRHEDNQKWYGIVMRVNRKSLGLSEDGEVDVLDVKCDEDMIVPIRMQAGILPGYHMNKKSWISILLDGTVDETMIKNLLDQSYEMTLKRSKGSKKSGVRTTQWIIPCNPKYYDVDQAFEENEIILWKQSNHICVGDIIYLYVGAPFSAIRYKCKAVEVDLNYQYEDKNLSISKAMKIQKLMKYDEFPISFELMKEYGVYAVRGPRSIPQSLILEIEHRYKIKNEK